MIAWKGVGLALLAFGLAGPATPQAPSSEDALLARLREDPGDGAARLALGALYYDQHRDRAAEFNLRQALASGLTQEQAGRARDLLAGLVRRRAFTFSADLTLAPNTSREVTSVSDGPPGEPTLVTTRREESGLGVIGVANAEYRVRLGLDTRLSLAGDVRTEDYGDDDFDDAQLTLFAGPLFLMQGDDRWWLRGLVQRRWFAGDVDFDAVGAEIALQRSLSGRLRAFTRFTFRDVDYDRFDARDGQSYGVDADLGRFGLEGRFERVFGLVYRYDAAAASERFWFLRAGAGAYRELPYAFGLYGEPSVAWQDFDGADALTGEARTDTEAGLLLRLSKRDIRVFSAAPFISVELSQIWSSVERFEASEAAAQFGFTRSF